MKSLILIIVALATLSCKAQTYPLNTYTDVPSNSYIKDLNNELLPYEGTWKGTWDNKTIFIYLKRIKKLQDHKENNPYYKDVIVGKFKITDSSNNILYDNTSLPDNNTKIEGLRFLTVPYVRYVLFYLDPDICSVTGDIYINFVNGNQNQLQWKFSDTIDILTSDCPYYNSNPFPIPFPNNIILTKQ